MIETLHISSYILIYVDILHIVNIVKQTFCKELDCLESPRGLDRHIRSFCVFDIFPVIKKHNTNEKT